MNSTIYVKTGRRLCIPTLSKILLTMQITATILLLACLQVSAITTYAQKVTIRERNAPLENVFKDIKRQTGYNFFYAREDLKQTIPVTLDLKNADLTKVLDKIFAAQPLTYTIDDRIIIVKPKPVLPITSELLPTIEITGQVIDSATGQPLVGVSIKVKGTTTGTITGTNGEFHLAVKDDAILVVSYLGYNSKEIAVQERNTLNISLSVATTGLEQLVVVGYGTQKKGDLTGAVVSLGAEDLNAGGTISNVAQALQGRASGVRVSQNSSAPGGSISIRIRGNNSISSTNAPLYVVDGFPTTNGLNINPSDIASIQILKDASATAIYGSRGANGVVLITTKRGEAGENEISYNGYVGIQKVINPFNMLDGKQYMKLANALYREIDGQQNQQFGVYTQSQLESDINTNWIDATTRLGVVQKHNLQFRGGSDKTKILTSVGYFQQEGILKNTKFTRISGRVNVDQKINDIISTGASLYAQREKSNLQSYGGNILTSNVLNGILNYDPTVPVYNKDGSFGRPPGGRGDNPLANLVARQNDRQRDRLNARIYLKLTPIPGLTAKMNAGTEIVHGKEGFYLPRSTYQGSIDEGVAGIGNTTSNHQLIDAFVTYKRDFNNIHSFSIMGGYSYEKFTNDISLVNVYGFSTDLYNFNNLDAASTISGVSSDKSEHLLISFFGRLNYALRDKYLFTFTLRRDGSSRFGIDNRWGTFPSGAFAWKLSQEPFIQDLGVFSALKLRLGYGKTGNERIGNYSSYALVSNTNYTFDGTSNSTGTALNSSTPENPKLKWETTSQYNVGLDMSFWESRLAVTMNAYYKKTSDLLIRVNLPLYSGFSSGISNIGAVENKGFEFSATSHNLIHEFQWNTTLNFAINRNKVLNIGDQEEILLSSSKPMGDVSEEAFAIIKEGKPLGSLYGYVYTGVLQEKGGYAPQPNAKPGDPKFKDVSGPDGVPDGKITSADRTIIGHAYPKFSYGILNTFAYKNFDLSVFLYGALGNDLLNMSRMTLEWKRTQKALDRWTPNNTNTNIPRNGFFYSQYGGYINSYFIEDASFLRLKTLTLGYTIPTGKLIESFRVYVMAQNILTLTSYSGWNPEVDTKRYENDPNKGASHYHGLNASSSNYQMANAGAGLDFNSYPSMRVFTFGLNITF